MTKSKLFKAVAAAAAAAVILALCIVSSKLRIENNAGQIPVDVKQTDIVIPETSPPETTVPETTVLETAVTSYETIIPKADPIVFYYNEKTKRVHTNRCVYWDSTMTKITGDSVELGRACTACNPQIEIKKKYIPETKPTVKKAKKVGGEVQSANFQATFYTGGAGTYGAYSRRNGASALISGYSVASSYFPAGTLLRVEGHGLDGVYRVDDTGCARNVIDFYYLRGKVPFPFSRDGRYSIKVSRVN
ncbi:MAG: hypothetical protein LBR54_02705 [Oscillospiraceae bacterium]|jgi:hypothetical protein|nr:hypothetical protein [Oscillospiraceae bacterium]